MIVLLPHCGFLSETSRMLAIARALEARGEQTLIASHGGPYERVLDEAGVRWERLAPGLSASDSLAFLDGLLSIGRGDRPMYPDGFIRRAVDAEAALFRRTGARLAVIGFNLTTYVSSRVAGIPLATSHGGSFVPPVLDRGLCPVPVNPPTAGMAKLPRAVQRWLANHVPRWFKAPARDLNRVATELGVQTLPSFMAMMCGDLTLVTELPEILGISREELEAWRPWRRRLWPSTTFRYTGPLFATLDMPIPERVEAFLRADGPVVYVAPTSVHAGLLRDMIGAVSATGARVLVAATIHDVRDLESERVMIGGVLPSHQIMPRVAACVIMGGQGSVQTAMTAGTPFVGMPHHGEQELNVALAEGHGVAIRMSPADAGTPRMTRAVLQLLDDPSYRDRARTVKAMYAGSDGAASCAREILTYLGATGTKAVPASRPGSAPTATPELTGGTSRDSPGSPA